ncbi:hypothetical protein [Lysinibacillus sp. NPDC086135]|uniref:hypothetical protein n=1 Tax=Lysinibacillus sp. NPDC086135 TaxID=3364130 RepID=UPI003828DF74
MDIYELRELVLKIRSSRDLSEKEKKFLIDRITRDLRLLEQRHLNSISVSSGSCNCCGKAL